MVVPAAPPVPVVELDPAAPPEPVVTPEPPLPPCTVPPAEPPVEPSLVEPPVLFELCDPLSPEQAHAMEPPTRMMDARRRKVIMALRNSKVCAFAS
jgi:hypothetical protein